MADEALNNTPTSANSGPPPSGGGSFDSNSNRSVPPTPLKANDESARLLSKWKPEVVAAYQALNPGAPFDNSALDTTQPFNRLDRLQKIQRRQLEQLTIARKLYRVKTGNFAPTDHALRDFFQQNRVGIGQLWQTAISANSFSGIPKFFADNYTLSETEDWLRDQELFGLSSSPTDVSKKDPEKVSEQINKASTAQKPVAGKVAAKPGAQPFTGTARPVDSVSSPQQPGQIQSALDDDIDDIPLPGGLEGVRLANQLASAARPRSGASGGSAAKPALSKRAAKRQRGKARASKQAGVNVQAQSAPDFQDDSAQLTQRMQSAQSVASEDAEIAAEAASQGGSSAVTTGSQISAAVTAAAKAKTAVTEKDDMLTPGFAEGEGSGKARQTGRLIQEGDEGGDFVRPGMVQSKARGGKSARGETIGIEANEADEAAYGEGEAGGAGRTREVGAGSKTAQGATVGEQQIGTGRSAKIARPTPEAEEAAAEAAVIAKGPAQAAMKGGVDAEIGEGEPSSIETGIGEESKPRINDQFVPIEAEAEGYNKSPSDDFVRSSPEEQSVRSKKAKGKGRGGENILPVETASAAAPNDQGLADDQSLTPGLTEEPDEQQGQPEQEEGYGNDFLPPQFAPGEYQTPQQKDQIARQKRASADKDKALDARRGKPQDQEEPGDDTRPLSDGQALDRFDQMNPADQLAHINQWLGKTSQKKKRIPSIGGLRLRLLEAAALKYPELKELLDEIKTESYKAARGISDLPGRKRKERSRSMEDEFNFWVEKVFAEYILKVWLFPYLTISAFFDGGVQAILALIALHIYWFIGMLFKNSGFWQGLLRWQKWLLAGIDTLVGLIILFVVLVGIYGFCQLPGVGLASKAASYVTTDVTYTFCNTINSGIGNISASPVGQNLAPVPAPVSPGP